MCVCVCIRRGILESLCQSVVLSMCPVVCAQYPEPFHLFFFLTKLVMVVHYHVVMCFVEKLVHYLQCQGHSEGLHKSKYV